MCDAEVDQMDSNHDGVISPVVLPQILVQPGSLFCCAQEEFYAHCRKNLAMNADAFEAAVQMHQDCVMDPVNPNAFKWQ